MSDIFVMICDLVQLLSVLILGLQVFHYMFKAKRLDDFNHFIVRFICRKGLSDEFYQFLKQHGVDSEVIDNEKI